MWECVVMLVPRAYARRMRESRLMSRIRECARVREVVNRTLRDGVRACGRVIWAAVLRAARVELWEPCGAPLQRAQRAVATCTSV